MAITDYSQTAASNTTISGIDIAEGCAPSGINNAIRQLMADARFLEALGSDIASAATTDIGAATGLVVKVTGTTTITALGTVAAGAWRIVRFTGALTLTHNATSLILPTGANIATAADDTALFYSLGSGNWFCVAYQRASGAALTAFAGGTLTSTLAMSGAAINQAKGSDIASAATTDIGAATGNFVDVTGTTTITGLGTVQAGTQRIVRFSGILTLTHNATSLILPTGANITTAAGDVAHFVSLGSGNWRCTGYMRASGNALATTSLGITTIASGSIAAAATQNITDIPATYAALHLKITGASSNTATRHPRIQLSTDNGSTVDSTAGNYLGATMEYSGGGVASSANEASVCPGLSDAAASVTWDIDVWISGYNGGPHLNFSFVAVPSSGNKVAGHGFYVGGTTAINAIRLLWNGSGNFDAGSYAMYGVN